MIGNQLALVRREFWEHRSIWVTPAAVALVTSLLVLTSYVAASGFGEVVDIAMFSASNVGDAERKAALMAFLVGITWVFMVSMSILAVFYCLDSLYAERKDKSILFWRSLPVTDAETVISKLLTAGVLIPLVTFIAVIATHLVNLVLMSIWISLEGGDAGHIVWGSVPLLDVWLAIFVLLVAMPLWLSPFVGWFIFVSAWTKRSPLLMAFLPIVIAPIIEYFILRTTLLRDAINTRASEVPLFKGFDQSAFFDGDNFGITSESISLLAHIDLGKFVLSPSLWAGLVVCGLFATAAIYVRRYRGDS